MQVAARAEFDAMVSTLRKAGIRLIVFEDTGDPVKPDAVFPNNWITTHRNGEVFLYPLAAANRRAERRIELLEALQTDHGFSIGRIVDLSPGERNGRFLEGTGSLVFDRIHRKAYAGLSSRTHPEQLRIFAAQAGYEIRAFETNAVDGLPVYHTNVMLSIGTGFAVVCPDVVVNPEQRNDLRAQLGETGRDIIDITPGQMSAFAGNLLEVRGDADRPLIVLSQAALDVLNDEQRDRLARCGTLLPVEVGTIERVGGGSVRCMLTEIFLPQAGGGRSA